MKKKTSRILGVDPGTNFLGYAVINCQGEKYQLLDIGVLKIKSLRSHQEKLRQIYLTIQEVINDFDPDMMAIEAPFFGKNVQAMLKLGRAQGVAIAAAMNMGIEISEYSPKKIKLSVTGNGNASKEQVSGMVRQIIGCKIEETNLDASDALAAALCHHIQYTSPTEGGSKYKNWAAFIKDNPEKVKI